MIPFIRLCSRTDAVFYGEDVIKYDDRHSKTSIEALNVKKSEMRCSCTPIQPETHLMRLYFGDIIIELKGQRHKTQTEGC